MIACGLDSAEAALATFVWPGKRNAEKALRKPRDRLSSDGGLLIWYVFMLATTSGRFQLITVERKLCLRISDLMYTLRTGKVIVHSTN